MNNTTTNNRANPDTLAEPGNAHSGRPEPEHMRSGTTDLSAASAGRRIERGTR
jgi:hypothetical protein